MSIWTILAVHIDSEVDKSKPTLTSLVNQNPLEGYASYDRNTIIRQKKKNTYHLDSIN